MDSTYERLGRGEVLARLEDLLVRTAGTVRGRPGGVLNLGIWKSLGLVMIIPNTVVDPVRTSRALKRSVGLIIQTSSAPSRSP